MDHQRFDALTRQLANRRSRRSFLKEFVAGLFAGTAAVAGAGSVAADSEPDQDRDANNGQGCKRSGKNCKNDNQCCSGLICPNGGSCSAGCRIGGVVYAPGANPANPCLTCNPTVSTSAWTVAAGSTCDDGNACTSGDICQDDGSCAGSPLLPVIHCPENQGVSSGSSLCGAVVSFTASADCASTTCTRNSGETFAVGITTVTCSADNAAGHAECSFEVNVSDDVSPDITCPANINQAATNASGAVVNFLASATDNCTPVSVTCSPPSGSNFGIGSTTVTCSAIDPSDRSDNCEFVVTVSCNADCSGKACGASDGCGGFCDGTCADPGPCKSAVCEPAQGCVATNDAPGTSCGDECNLDAICNDSGACVDGFPRTCPESTDPCRSRFGNCDPAVGCVYDRLPEGEICGNQGNACEPYRCTATGSCQSSPVTCGNDECQFCDPASGICRNETDGTVCGDGLGYCSGGTCESPCGSACMDYCYRTLDEDNVLSGPYFCCPEASRGPDGGCCWVQNQGGLFSDDGRCASPRQICADGLYCNHECCGSSDNGFAGACPGADEYCSDGELVSASLICTTDTNCVTAGYGASAVCADVEYTFSEDDPVPVADSGFCCPIEHQDEVSFESGGPVYSCCSPGTRRTATGECCNYPAYASGACIGCECSFRNITRCCS